jgi:hypothetical protein
MRDQNREAWFLNYVTSVKHFENAAQACEDFADLFNRLLTGHGLHGAGKLDYWVSRYLQNAQQIRRKIEFAQYGDYIPIADEMSEAYSNIRGVMEQRLGNFSEEEMKAFNDAFDRLRSLCAVTVQALANARNAGRRWLERDQLEKKYVNRDEGNKGDYQKYLSDLQKEGILPTLEDYPRHQVDKSRPCQAGEITPWTGVWIPQQALDEGITHFSLAFALKGTPMQPAFRIELKPAFRWLDENGVGECPYIKNVTTAEDATWYPLVEVAEQPAAVETVSAHRGRAEAKTPCPRSGYWWTPAKQDSRRYVNQGDIMPDFPDSSYGLTIWGWDIDQTNP